MWSRLDILGNFYIHVYWKVSHLSYFLKSHRWLFFMHRHSCCTININRLPFPIYQLFWGSTMVHTSTPITFVGIPQLTNSFDGHIFTTNSHIYYSTYSIMTLSALSDIPSLYLYLYGNAPSMVDLHWYLSHPHDHEQEESDPNVMM